MAKISRLFIILLGLAYLVNFWALHNQIVSLIGSDGLMPIAPDLPLIKQTLGSGAYWKFPTLFWIGAEDSYLYTGTLIGLLLSFLLIFRVAQRFVLILLWILFLSYVNAGRIFFTFQWDNLMLEATLIALFLPAKKGVSPNPWTVFLMRWLAFRLYFESGIAKIWAGKAGGWLDFSAMQSYYDTAPLPTPLGWWAHQLPQRFHQVESLMTLVLEIAVPLLIFFGRKCRLLAFCLLAPLQIAIFLTANYGIFNYMTLAALLFLLEDKDIERVKRFVLKWFRKSSRSTGLVETVSVQKIIWPVKGIISVFVLITVLNFTTFLKPVWAEKLNFIPLQSWTAPFRSLNVYHLFAHMTRERVVIQIEGSDGVNWKPYRFRYYASDPKQRPKFAAPYHPRLDFRLWFLTLSRQSDDWLYVNNLLKLICNKPYLASKHFAENPFPFAPPKAVRLIFYKMKMSDFKTGKEEKVWWTRGEAGRSKILFCGDLL